jgi:hypothetical protein
MYDFVTDTYLYIIYTRRCLKIPALTLRYFENEFVIYVGILVAFY